MINLKERFTIQVYNIGITSTSIIDNGINKKSIKWLKHDYKDRFFADPFLWYQDQENYYILVEEMCFFEEYGKIVLLTINKLEFSLKNREVIIQEPFHLSFPYCELNKNIIIPEAAQSGKCTCYRISRETHKIISKEIIADEGIIDPIFVGQINNSLLLGSKVKDPNNKLYMFKKNDQGKYIVLTDKPLIKGKKNSRNGGAIFQYNNKLYRPAQDCIQRYGCGIQLMNISDKTDEGYFEKKAQYFSSKNSPLYNETFHTFNVYGDIVIVDGSIDIYCMRNYIYKIRKLINRYINKFRRKYEN